MQIIASTTGKKVTANATTLSQALAQGATTVYFTHGVFTNGQSVIIHQEEITLGTTADSGLTFTGCTRGANSTSDVAHGTGQEAFLKGGLEIVSHTFDGSTFLNLVLGSANMELTWGWFEDAVLKFKPRITPDKLGFEWPTVRYQPTGSKVLSLAVWLNAAVGSECEADGLFQS